MITLKSSLLLVVLALVGGPLTASSQPVAIFSGVEILRSEVHIDSDVLPNSDKLSNGEILAQANQLENRRLSSRLNDIVTQQVLDEYNISASEEEIEAHLDYQMRIVDFNQDKVDQINELSVKVAEALDYSLSNQESTDQEIYDLYLSNTDVSYDSWKLYRKYNGGSKEKVDEFKSLIPNNLDDVKRMSHASAKKDVLLVKIARTLFPDVEISDEEKAAVQEGMKRRPEESQESFDSRVKFMISKMNEKARGEAWQIFLQSQFETSSITLMDSKYQEYLEQIGFREIIVSHSNSLKIGPE